MPKVLILAGDAVEALEIMYPYQRLQEEGIDVQIAAPTKKTLQSVVHDFEPGVETYTEKLGYRVEAHKAFADVKPEDYDGVVIPGGRAPEYIRNEAALPDIVRHFLDSGKPIAAICHALLVLSAVEGSLKGRRVTAYPALKLDLAAAGAEYVDQEVVVDGNLVTSRAWPDHPAFMREFLKLLRQR
jgi:protease I